MVKQFWRFAFFTYKDEFRWFSVHFCLDYYNIIMGITLFSHCFGMEYIWIKKYGPDTIDKKSWEIAVYKQK